MRLFSNRFGASTEAPLFIPLLFLVSLSLVFILTPLDSLLQSLFYNPVSGWHLSNAWPLRFAYDSGELPALILSSGALLVAIVGCCSRWMIRWRRQALFVALAMLLGPGILVNSVFKEHVGRPRPLHTEAFGGNLPYHQIGEIGFPRECKSFPSGHAAMGFFFCNLYFVWKGSRRRLAKFMLLTGITLGCWIGLARIAQGAHWPSDILWSFGVVYLSGYLLSRLMLPAPAACSSEVSLACTLCMDLEDGVPVSSGTRNSKLLLNQARSEFGAPNPVPVENI